MRPVAIAPFFRASVAIGADERGLFARALTPREIEARVRGRSPILRQNLRRLFAAALLAHARGGHLVFAEGWRSNVVVLPSGRARSVTGSWLFAVWLRLLQRRRLIPASVRARRADVSRCTWEEARAINALTGTDVDLIGVSDAPCPSAARASRYLRGGRVLTPQDALAQVTAPLSEDQRGFWTALQPRRRETLLGAVVEAPNWVVHGLSELLGRFVPLTPPLEVRLARALRRDRRTPVG